MRLSENFTLHELTKSSTAIRLGIENTPNEQQIESLDMLANNILQPVRDQFGSFIVSSGFRCLQLNRIIGSKDTSQHPKGEAGDFEIFTLPNYELAKWIEKNLNFDKLILEFYRSGVPNSGWIHCSYISDKENANKSYTYSGGRYKEGLFE